MNDTEERLAQIEQLHADVVVLSRLAAVMNSVDEGNLYHKLTLQRTMELRQLQTAFALDLREHLCSV